MSTGEQSPSPSLTVTVQNYKTFKALDTSLFNRFYLGYPYCLEKAGSFLLEREDLKLALTEIKALGKEAYLVTPPIMQNADFDFIGKVIAEVLDYGLDGLEINDVGMLAFAKRWPSLKITAGHFTNIYHPEAALEYIKEGVTTVIPNSELTMVELEEIVDKTNRQSPIANRQIEIAVYGNLPLGFAYDCFLKQANAEDKCRQQCTKPYIISNDEVAMASVGRANVMAADFCLIEQTEEVKSIGASLWRLEMYKDSAEKINKIADAFKSCINGEDTSSYIGQLEELAEQGLCNGWFFGESGHEYVGKLPMYNYQSTIANLDK